MKARTAAFILVVLLIPSVVSAAQGFTCDAYLSLGIEKQRWYLRGYLLGLGSPIAELKSVIGHAAWGQARRDLEALSAAELRDAKPLLRVVRHIEHLERRSTRAMRDPIGFEESVFARCSQPDVGWAGMFEVIPYAIQEMPDSGESEWPMAGELRQRMDRH